MISAQKSTDRIIEKTKKAVPVCRNRFFAVIVNNSVAQIRKLFGLVKRADKNCANLEK